MAEGVFSSRLEGNYYVSCLTSSSLDPLSHTIPRPNHHAATEIIAYSDAFKRFEEVNAKVVGISTDTEESHLAWVRTPRRRGGLGHMQIPLVADVTKTIAADYGVLIEDIGIALRGLFLIDPEGMLQQITVNNLPVGRNVDETIRLIQAFQFVAKHGEVCPGTSSFCLCVWGGGIG